MKKFSSITRVNSRRTSQTKKRIGLAVIFLLTMLFLWWAVPQLISSVAAMIMTPIQSTKTWLFESTGNFPMYVRDRNALIAENEKLRAELALQGKGDHSIMLLQKENDELRGLLGADEKERMLAAIIGRPDMLPYDVLVADRGSADGVVLHAPVYIGDNRVIGVVTHVYENSSVVEMVTSPGVKSSVFIVGPDIYTNAIGIGGGQLRVGVPQGIELSLGDGVVLPAVSSGIFGTINHIESHPTQPEQLGFVSTDVPLQSLRYVAIGSTPLAPVSFKEVQERVADVLNPLLSVPVPPDLLMTVMRATSSTTSVPALATTTASSS